MSNKVFNEASLLLFLVLYTLIGYAQGNDSESHQSFPRIYAFEYRYGPNTQVYFENGTFHSARILTQGMIDPNSDGKFDREVVKKFVEKYYPDKTSVGLCILDWEGSNYRDLKRLGSENGRFRAAMDEYVNLIRYVKSIRPNLQVSIYGLPFRFFFPNQRQYNQSHKLDGVLKYCDFIAPSLYIMYTDKQIGHSRNIKYLRDNLEMAFSYGRRLNKPVIPFVWYRIHPSNKQSAWGIIPKNTMVKYLGFMRDFEYQGTKIEGIIWWDQNVKGAMSTLRRGADLQLSAEKRGDLLVEYTLPLLD